MTKEERILELHRRVEQRRRKKEAGKTAVLGVMGGLLMVFQLIILVSEAGMHAGTAASYAGTMMLFDNVGGYVLTAVVAFMAGALITAAIKNRQPDEQKSGKTNGIGDKQDSIPEHQNA